MGDYIPASVCIIVLLCSKRLVIKGCTNFLSHLKDDTSKVPLIVFVLIVREFVIVFLADLPCMEIFRDMNLVFT